MRRGKGADAGGLAPVKDGGGTLCAAPAQRWM